MVFCQTIQPYYLNTCLFMISERANECVFKFGKKKKKHYICLNLSFHFINSSNTSISVDVCFLYVELLAIFLLGTNCSVAARCQTHSETVRLL